MALYSCSKCRKPAVMTAKGIVTSCNCKVAITAEASAKAIGNGGLKPK